MKSVIALLGLFAVAGCSSAPKKFAELTPDELKIKSTVSNVDGKVFAQYAKEHGQNLSDFSQDIYMDYLNRSKADHAQEVKDLLPSFDVKQFFALKDTFLFCAYSSKLELAFCDDAACQGTEYFAKAESVKALDAWKEELPLKACVPETPE
jgi:hypothetical protein